MSSRATILAALRGNLAEPLPLPQQCDFPIPEGDLSDRFAEQIFSGGGRALWIKCNEIAPFLADQFAGARIASTVPEYVQGNIDLLEVRDPRDLAPLDVMVCRADLGVAECGAVWLSDQALIHRASAFITQHLVVLLEQAAVVWNMHQAYSKVNVAQHGFAVWVAGPSKTADIEQSLVIGAHGARSFTVLLT